MASEILFDDGLHRNILLEDFGHGEAVQANQHLIIHGGQGMILDPGGHKVYARALAETTAHLAGGKLQYIFLSHQDPDIVAAVNGWLMTTDAIGYTPSLWLRFIPHFGLDRLVSHRLRGIPDEGLVLDLNGAKLPLLPAHFLHSPGNFQVYDPISKILYSGDLGASLGTEEKFVTDFDAHVKFMEGFHTRYLAGNRALKTWARMVRTLDIETIAPQHGAILRGRALCQRFIDWCDALPCGMDLLPETWVVPTA